MERKYSSGMPYSLTLNVYTTFYQLTFFKFFQTRKLLIFYIRSHQHSAPYSFALYECICARDGLSITVIACQNHMFVPSSSFFPPFI